MQIQTHLHTCLHVLLSILPGDGGRGSEAAGVPGLWLGMAASWFRAGAWGSLGRGPGVGSLCDLTRWSRTLQPDLELVDGEFRAGPSRPQP